MATSGEGAKSEELEQIVVPHEEPPSDTPEPVMEEVPVVAYPIGIFTVALFVRIYHLFQIHTAPFYALLMGDARGYDAWARAMEGGDWIGKGVFYQAPLYPYFVGMIYTLFDEEPTLVRIIQMALGSMACVLIALAAHRLFGKWQGVIAGLLLASFPPAIFFDALIQKTSLDLFLFCWLIWLIALSVEQTTWLRALGLGLVLGGLILTRENALVFVPWLFIWLLRRPDQKSRAIGFVIGLVVVLSPVVARNHKVSGEWHLTTAQSGPNLYIGNHDRATGTYVPLRRGRGNVVFEQADAIAIAEADSKRRMTAGEVSTYWRDRALDWIGTNPDEWLSLTGRKLMLSMNAVEAADTEDLYTHLEWSPVLRVVNAAFHFGVLAPLGLFGMWLLRGRWREIGIFHVMTVAYLTSVLLFYVVARYRFPLTPLFVLFASAVLVEMPSWWRKAGSAERTRDLAVFAAAIALCNWPIQSIDAMRAVTRYNVADAFREAGQNDDAIAQFREAIALDPQNSAALSNLGALLAEKGDHTEALRLYDLALTADPRSAIALNNRGQELMLRARTEEGIASFKESIALDPLNAEPHRNLAMAFASTNRTEDAIREFGEALRLNPEDAITHNNLGIVLAASGRVLDGRAHFDEALRLKPDFAEAAANLKRVDDSLVSPAPAKRQ